MLRLISTGQRPLPIQNVVCRLEDTLQTMTDVPFLKESNLSVGDLSALYKLTENLKFRVMKLSQVQSTIDSREFYHILVKEFQVIHQDFSSETVYLFLAEPLIDQLFQDYEPWFCEELKSWFVPTKITRIM